MGNLAPLVITIQDEENEEVWKDFPTKRHLEQRLAVKAKPREIGKRQ
jgi:hypothetical protein